MTHHPSNTFKKATGGAIGIVALLVALVALNALVSNLRLRVDLTEERLYTLSKGSRTIVGRLDQDTTLKLFFNRSAPEVPVYLKHFARQVEDLLHEYELASKGRIIIERYDPKPDSDAEDWARRYGISGQQLGLMGPAVYLGLVGVVGDTEAVIPFVDPRTEALLEYNITRLIYRLNHPSKPVVGVLSSLPVLGSTPPSFVMPGQPPPPRQEAWTSFKEMQQDFDVRSIDPAVEAIADDIQALLVVHPKELPGKALYAIDQFVLRGGRLMVFVDPMSLMDLESAPPPMGGMRPPNSASDLGVLFSTWGIGYDATKMLADMGSASRIRGAGNRVEESPVWLSLTARNLNADDILTSGLESMMVPFAGTVEDLTGDGIEFTPLIVSSERSGLVNAFMAQFGGDALRREYKESGVEHTLAARLSGTFRTAFPDGPPADTAGDERGDEEDQAPEAVPPGLKEGTGTIVVVADVDMLGDRFCVQAMNFFGHVAHQPINDNLAFVANAIEQLSGSADLIGIRSRGRMNRPFDRVQALEAEARAQWQEQEAQLEQNLREAQQQINELQGQKAQGQEFILSPQQEAAISNFRDEEARISRELKEVRKSLRRNIEVLGMRVKAINIALMPLLVALAGIIYGLRRRRRA